MAYQKKSDDTFTMEKVCETLAISRDDYPRREINIISWNGADPVLDIRTFFQKKDGTITCGKGATFDRDSALWAVKAMAEIASNPELMALIREPKIADPVKAEKSKKKDELVAENMALKEQMAKNQEILAVMMAEIESIKKAQTAEPSFSPSAEAPAE